MVTALLNRLKKRADYRRAEADSRLLMAFHAGEKLHGDEISQRSGLRSGRMYPALSRAEATGRLGSGWDDGHYPRRRHYYLTPQGEWHREPRWLP